VGLISETRGVGVASTAGAKTNAPPSQPPPDGGRRRPTPTEPERIKRASYLTCSQLPRDCAERLPEPQHGTDHGDGGTSHILGRDQAGPSGACPSRCKRAHTARRWGEVIRFQSRISARVRPQPTHTAPASSSRQTEMQGEGTSSSSSGVSAITRSEGCAVEPQQPPSSRGVNSFSDARKAMVPKSWMIS